MRTRRALLTVAAMGVLAACPDEPEPPPPTEPPPLSGEPRWTLEAPASLRDSCFGSSLALGDLDGDGLKDLVVAAPPCALAQGPGHVALYAGRPGGFSSEPVIAQLDWQHPDGLIPGVSMRVSIGDVDGDRFGDLLVSSLAGTMLFSGQPRLDALLQAPRFRIYSPAVFRGGHLEDLNGDGLEDLINSTGQGPVSIYLAQPGQSPEPFTLSRTVLGQRVQHTGDADGDGLGDLLVRATDGSRLYRGCRPGPDCEGGVSAQPLWKVSENVLGLHPDQNGDGRAELFLGGGWHLALHLSEPSSAGISPTPVWTMLGDPLYPNLGQPLLTVGDMNGDGRATEFLVGAAGRLYLYVPSSALSSELRPAWAWPPGEAQGARLLEQVQMTALAAGDLDSSGQDDLLVGVPPLSAEQGPGRVVALSGGQVAPDAPAPFLPEPRRCAPPLTQGTPDLTVDGNVLARSMFVDTRTFEQNSCELAEGCVLGPGPRRLLRFSVSIPNLGTGPAVLPSPEEAPHLYQYDACHEHDHLTGFAGYELLDSQGALTVRGRKQGFFLVDLAPYCLGAPSQDFEPAQGISAGWADIYLADLPCQWLDITDVPDGAYTLRVSVNDSGLIDELDEHPNFATVKLRLAGQSVEVEP